MTWWKMGKTEKKPDLRNQAQAPAPKPLTEIEIAVRVARIRALTEYAEKLVAILKNTKAEIEVAGGHIEIVAEPKVIHYASYSGRDEVYEATAFTVKANYTAAL